jgi:hypothetical protein
MLTFCTAMQVSVAIVEGLETVIGLKEVSGAEIQSGDSGSGELAQPAGQ